MKNNLSKTMALSFALATSPILFASQEAAAQSVPTTPPVCTTTTVDTVNKKVNFTNTCPTVVDFMACVRQVFSGPVNCVGATYNAVRSLPPSGVYSLPYTNSGTLTTNVRECPVNYKLPNPTSNFTCIPR